MSEASDDVQAPGMFDGVTAWFSDSVHPEYRTVWEHEDGLSADAESAQMIFSADPDSSDTLNMFASRAYLCESLAVFHPAYIDQCVDLGSSQACRLAQFFLLPTDVQKVVGKRKRPHWESMANLRQNLPRNPEAPAKKTAKKTAPVDSVTSQNAAAKTPADNVIQVNRSEQDPVSIAQIHSKQDDSNNEQTKTAKRTTRRSQGVTQVQNSSGNTENTNAQEIEIIKPIHTKTKKGRSSKNDPVSPRSSSSSRPSQAASDDNQAKSTRSSSDKTPVHESVDPSVKQARKSTESHPGKENSSPTSPATVEPTHGVKPVLKLNGYIEVRELVQYSGPLVDFKMDQNSCRVFSIK